MMLKLQKILKKPNTVRLQGVFEAKKDSVKPKKEKWLNGVKRREDVENGAYFLWYFLLVGVNVRAGSYKYQLESKIEKLAKKKQKKVHKKD